MRVENTVGNGEIALYEQFLRFPQCFEKTCTANTLKQGLVWVRVNILLKPGKQLHKENGKICTNNMVADHGIMYFSLDVARKLGRWRFFAAVLTSLE